jgi:hypothetical protein
MNAKTTFFTLTIIASLIVTSLTIIPQHILTYADTSVSIDLFTQKAPYDGKGPNQSSDMFGPQETVVLYALVLVNGAPANGKLVAFEINGPLNILEDIKFYQSAETNASGTAETYFSLAVINETSAFGTWTVIGKVEVDGKIYSDMLTFQVGWIVELISIRTLDGNLSNRKYFGIGGYVGMEIALRNNAMAKKTARVGIAIFDELGVAINSFEIDNFIVPPGRIQYVYNSLFIPKYAVPGNATITVVALSDYGVPYCPGILANFWITIYNPISPNFIDASVVYVDISPTKAQPGENIAITILVRNEGTVTLSNFYVSVHANTSLVDSRFINYLDPYASQIFYITWDTKGLSEGNYIVTVDVPIFPNEADLSDNIYTSLVELRTIKPTFIHDIQVVNVTCSKNEVYQGETVTITATVRNNGNATESTNVSTYYNSFLIQEKGILGLAPAAEQTLIFEWNTTSVPERLYRISAIASPVEGEINTADNTYYDGLVKIKLRLPQITHDVAITALSASPNVTEAGAPVTITTIVKNLGNFPESFDETLFYDNFPMTVLHVDFLAPSDEQSLTFVWNTSGMMEGNYTIKAYIPPVPDEQIITNNWCTDGTVWIKAPPLPVKKHDVAIIAVNASKYQAYIGDIVEITVKAANLGDFAETLNVTAYANMFEVGVRNVVLLDADSNMTLSFVWDTSSMKEGNYTIWAFVDTVLGEIDTANNVLVDDKVTLRTPPISYIHDVTVVSVQPSSRSVFIGEKLTVSVKVKNNGTVTESFNVTLYYDSTPIQKETVHSLPPTMEETIIFQWNTSNVEEGIYTISAYAEPVPEETNLANNWLEDGTITVKKLPPSITHDIAVVWLSAEPTEVYVGENITIKITVLNLGNAPESFNVTAYYDSNIIDAIPVVSLSPYTQETITLEWNTTNAKTGVYTLGANATILEGEINIENNSFTDGKITIKPTLVLPFWTFLIPFLIGLAIIILLLIIYYLKKRKKKAITPPRYIVLLHPHI